MSKRTTACALVVSTALGVLLGNRYLSWRENQPVYIFGEDAAKADPSGPAFAEQRAAALIPLILQTGGNPGEIGLNNLRLPDQASAEDPRARLANISAWTLPEDACFKDIALYTDLYAKRNHRYYKGDKMNAEPSGFLIVGMKSGEVKRIPVSETRLMPYNNGAIMAFPGVIGYKDTLPPCPSYETLK